MGTLKDVPVGGGGSKFPKQESLSYQCLTEWDIYIVLGGVFFWQFLKMILPFLLGLSLSFPQVILGTFNILLYLCYRRLCVFDIGLG